MKKGRTPLKTPPLRSPGESLLEKLDETLHEKAFPYILLISFSPIWIAYEWLRYLNIYTPHPAVLTFVAVLFCVFSVLKLRGYRNEIRTLRRGYEAEKSVGQYLEQFRMQGYQIFHDIPGESGGKKFNLDHVIIGPKGIFTIETKYARKPEKGETRIQYDGQQILINGAKPDRDPVVQAKAQTHWLYDRLKQSTGKSFFVKPVVVYPGWFVPDLFDADVWVINPDRLSTFVEAHNIRLSDADIHLAKDHLSRYIQSSLK
jgi:hypothetical protein